MNVFDRVTIYKKELRKRGLFFFLSLRMQKLSDIFLYRFIVLYHKKKHFVFNKKRFRYSLSRYNYTWKNERTIEIPLAYSMLQSNKNKDVLEVGNVLSHYYNVEHDIIDKYEQAKGVLNKDVATFKPTKKYDLIIAISTLEHVGWEESPRDPQKIIPTLKNLKSLLKKNGKIFVTLPIGYTNPFLNEQILNKSLGFDEMYYLKRSTLFNDWHQTELEAVKNTKYNSPYPNANAIMVGVINF